MLRKIIIGLFSTLLISCTSQTKLNDKTCGDESIYCGVSLVNLIVEPNKYDNKIVSLQGYFHIAPRGPFQGYWLSMDKDNLDFDSSVKLKIPSDAPQVNWVKNGDYYRAVGVFKNCTKVNCHPEIIEYEKAPGIVVPAT